MTNVFEPDNIEGELNELSSLYSGSSPISIPEHDFDEIIILITNAINSKYGYLTGIERLLTVLTYNPNLTHDQAIQLFDWMWKSHRSGSKEPFIIRHMTPLGMVNKDKTIWPLIRKEVGEQSLTNLKNWRGEKSGDS